MIRFLSVIALVFVWGCIGSKVVDTTPPIVTPLSQPLTPTINHTSNVSITAPSSLLVMLHQYLGDSNRFTLQSALVHSQPEIKVTIPAGASISYTLSDSKGVFTFNDPRPVTEIVEFGITLYPVVESVCLNPDNSGTFAATVAGVPVHKKFNLQWTDQTKPKVHVSAGMEPFKLEKPTQSKATDTRPEVWMFVKADGDVSQIDRDRLESDVQPFRVTVKTEVPAWLKGHLTLFPAFYWVTDADTVDKGKHFSSLQSPDAISILPDEWKKSRYNSVSFRQNVRGFDESVIQMANPWFEVVNGRKHPTSPHHLLNTHHIPATIVDKYRHNQSALDRLHGAAHSGLLNF